MKTKLSRRAALAGAVSLAPAAAAAAVPIGADPSGDDATLLPLLQRFEPVGREFWADHLGDVLDELSDEMVRARAEILKHKATTREGLAVRVRVLLCTYCTCFGLHPDSEISDMGVMTDFLASVASFSGIPTEEFWQAATRHIVKATEALS